MDRCTLEEVLKRALRKQARGMKELPIIFSPHSVREILAGRKTQTRRVIKRYSDEGVSTPASYYDGMFWFEDGDTMALECSYGGLGDRLWVKEPWSLGKSHDERTPHEVWSHLQNTRQGVTVLYKAGGWKSVAPFERQEPVYPDNEPMPEWAGKRRHAMFMPRWASRITLEITDQRAERLQDISEKDIAAEGVHIPSPFVGVGSDGYPIESEHCDKDPWWFWQQTWDSINGEKHPWSANPLVWALTFRRIEP
ncbi:MAG TPA: hypothetical protein VFW94_23460 [Candidatus Acidoferrales bacterium]|nr:hypothetical protein [Candidatus Acidoferrales bacterium]